MRIERLSEQHLLEAANLFAEAYKKQRAIVPILPERHENPDNILKMLQRISETNPGVAAIEDGKLVGYMVGFLVNQMKSSHKGVYVPDWGHSSTEENKLKIYQELYSSISGEWVSKEHFTHGITMFVYDRALHEQFFWNGFGMLTVDCVRALDTQLEYTSLNQEITVRDATIADMNDLLYLQNKHQRYYAKAPTFMAQFEMDDEKVFEERFQNPDHHIYIAYKGGQPVGFMWANPGSHDGCYITTDPETASITGAFVDPDQRNSGVGMLLLQTITQWAFEKGFKRISLDFEAANVLGGRFWLRSFEPVCYSLMRKVDDRLTKAANYIEK